MKKIKFTYEEVKNYVEVESNSGCKLLSTEYIGINKKLEFQCKCGNKFETTLSSFKNKNKQHCKECGQKIFKEKVLHKKEWFQEKLDEKFGHKYIVLEYVNTSTNATVRHIECGAIISSRPYTILSWSQNGCPQCTGKYAKTTEIFKQEVYDKVGDEYTVLGEYINSGTPMMLKHNKCGNTYPVRMDNFVRGNRCPYCSGRIVTTQDFKKRIHDLVGDEYELISEHIIGNNKITLKHTACGEIFETTLGNFIQGKRCPCIGNKGEKRIRDYLKENNIKFKEQYWFDDCRGKRNPLRFDFAIFHNDNLEYLIEYDGGQHFWAVDYYGGEEKFKTQQKYDNIKNEYCKNNNIELVRIPYWEFDNIEEILYSNLCQIIPLSA